MSKKIHFIHAADLHLGSFLHTSSDLPSGIREPVREATAVAFSRICDAAVACRADFLLLAGDVYDREARSIRAARFLAEKCRELEKENIPVFIIAGNHDPLREQRELFDLPGNVRVFSPEKAECLEIKDRQGKPAARVLGQSYRGRFESRRMHDSFTVPDKGLCNIALLHTQLEPGDKNYLPCSLAELTARDDIHYWALGHIHRCRLLHHGQPAVAYPGIPQGRDFGEEGPGGCLLVEKAPEDPPVISYIPVSPVIWQRVEVSIANPPVKNLTELENRLLATAGEITKSLPALPEGLQPAAGAPAFKPTGYILQWVITGRGELHDLLAEQEEEAATTLTEILRRRLEGSEPFLWTDSVVIRTARPLPGMEELLAKNPVFRELEMVSARFRNDPTCRRELAESLGRVWESSPDHENRPEDRFFLHEEMLNTVIDRARELILENLAAWGENR